MISGSFFYLLITISYKQYKTITHEHTRY